MAAVFKRKIIKSLFFLSLFFYSSIVFAQTDSTVKPKSDFWEKVRFGGGIGLSTGSGYTNISISPTMYYNVNSMLTFGAGLNGSYLRNKGVYDSWIYGGSITGIVNPIEFVQLSAELEQLRVNSHYISSTKTTSDNFWNTALFLGGGYRANNFTIGARYNVLYKSSNGIYADSWMPFVRIVF